MDSTRTATVTVVYVDSLTKGAGGRVTVHVLSKLLWRT